MVFTMDKITNKKSILESPEIAVHGYSIERGDTTYRNTLEERIQAAKEASLAAKQAQKKNNKEKHSLANNLNTALKSDTYFQNMTVKNNKSSDQELKKKNTQSCSSSFKNDFKPMINVLSSNTTIPKNVNTNLQAKYNTNSFFKPTRKVGVMQRRLEAIKANKKLSNTIAVEYNNALESGKSTNILSNNLDSQSTQTNNNVPNQSNIIVSKCNEYKTISTVQKSPCSEIKCYDYIRNINNTSDNLASSVQNRLIKAKAEMIDNKFKHPNKIEPVYSLVNIHQDTNVLKCKKKRLGHLNHIKKRTPSITSNTNEIIPNNLDINKINDTQLQVAVLAKLIVPEKIMPDDSDTIISTKLKNQDLLKKSKKMELDSFSFVLPETYSDKKLDDISRPQFSNDDSMEWEDIIEPINIVDKVNDLRKNTYEYEPMEWTPDSIMHADQINHCLVIDTNILLSDLNLITVIIDKQLPEYGYLTIVLPWQVLQELDCIKKGETALSYRAREATRWLLEMLSKKHPRLKGQPFIQKSNVNADDSILKCAIIVKERVNFVTLVTNDKILSIKSEVTGISVQNSTWLHNLVSIKKTNESEVFQEAVQNYPIIDIKSIMKFESHLEHIIARVLKFAVGHNMNSTTNNDWWKIYSLTPPFNLIKCLLILKEHWNLIAPEQLLFKTPKRQLDWLINFFKNFQKSSPEIKLDWNELYIFLKCCTEVINILPYEYYDITDVLLNDLMKARTNLYRKLENINNTSYEESSISLLSNLNISNDNILNIDNVLLNISCGVDTFCSCVYKAHGFKRNTSENEYIKFTKAIYSIKVIEDYCHKLSNIIKVMLKINKWKIEEILNSNIIINEFIKAIVDFDNDFIELNKESLIEYCLMKNKNSFLKTLISFQNNLAAMKNLLITISS